MANAQHIGMLQKGVKVWNEWRFLNPDEPQLSQSDFRSATLRDANFSKANFGGADLTEADLSGANLRDANLGSAKLERANLAGADLCGAYLGMAVFSQANLSGANLCRAQCFETDFTRADLSGASLNAALFSTANFSSADLTGADLRGAVFGKTNLQGALLINCFVYGVSVWDVNLSGSVQKGLVLTTDDEPSIVVDELEIAQFVYLLLSNEKIRRLIDTITTKVVLVLGSFKPERNVVLEAIRQELRRRDYIPVIFDFERPRNQSTTETVSTLAHMAKFVIADLTDAKSVLQELQTIVPFRTSLPVQPILLSTQSEPGMFDSFQRYPWMLNTFYYNTTHELLEMLTEQVIQPAERKFAELTYRESS